MYIPRKREIRFKSYDYSKPGTYIVTICTQNRWGLFGKFKDGEVELNQIGKCVLCEIKRIENRYSNIEVDDYRILPNHIHLIITIPVPIDPGDIIWCESSKTDILSLVEKFKESVARNIEDKLVYSGKSRMWKKYCKKQMTENCHLEFWEYISKNLLKWQKEYIGLGRRYKF